MDGGLVEGVDGWWLAAEGAAIRPGEGVAVVADVHLGYEWARGEGGDVVPCHSLGETIGQLGRLFERCEIERLVVAGDLVETGRCRRTRRDVEKLAEWVESRGSRLIWLEGNHDAGGAKGLEERLEVAGWTVAHGHRPIEVERLVSGHIHPVLRVGGLTAPCFLVSDRLIVLPAFSRNAAGQDVTEVRLPKGFADTGVRVVAGVGSELLDFGLLAALARQLGG